MRIILFFLLYLSVEAGPISSGGPLSENQKAMDVSYYTLDIKVDPYRQTISGSVKINFKLFRQVNSIELDLKDGYVVSGTLIDGMSLAFKHENNKILIDNPGIDLFSEHVVEIKYGGKPPKATNPPWDGGFTWETSEDGSPWIGVSCQSNGAHIWYPCKEHPSDKSIGADIFITVPDPLMAISNGLLQSVNSQKNKWSKWHWKTKYPISTYNINITIGNFSTIEKEAYVLNEPLSLVYYVLPEKENGGYELLDEAEEHIRFYASHFGQYPWIDEKFGLVHTPYSGMEHQTINAYGNNYKKTKRGYDFILFHEAGHEWWGNYLSVSDWADFWIHEGFDTYAEAIYVEEKYGIESRIEFVKNRFRGNIKNEFPVVPKINAVAKNRSGNDVYYKGAFILHMLRYLIGYDILKGSLREFLHMPKELPDNQTSTSEFISLINENAGQDLDWFFKQYLYKAEPPTLKLAKKQHNDKVYIDIWWDEEGFKMPLDIVYNSFDGKRERKLELNNRPKRIVIPKGSDLLIDPDEWILFEMVETN